MFDQYGAPISQEQEFDRLVTYFRTLFIDVHNPLQHPPSLRTLPFTEADVQLELERLSTTKALAPDGFPALIWKHFAQQLAPHRVWKHSSSLDHIPMYSTHEMIDRMAPSNSQA